MIRVLHITRDFPPHGRGGMSTAVLHMVAAAREAGFLVQVVSFDSYRPFGAAARPRVLEAHNSDDNVCRVTGQATAAVACTVAQQFAPALIHVHDSLLWEFAHELASQCHCRIVANVHVLHFMQDRLRSLSTPTLGTVQQRDMLISSAWVVAPSLYVRNLIVQWLPSVAAKVLVLPLGLPPENPCEHAPKDAKERVVLYAGRFGDIKGTDTFIEALALLRAKSVPHRVVVAGGLPDNPKSQRRWLRRFDDACHYAGWLSPDELCALRRHCNVVVVPSRFETFGLALLEALWQATPVVASAIGAFADLLGDSDHPILISPGDPQGLALAIERTLEQYDEARSQALALKQEVQEKYAWSSFVQATRRVNDFITSRTQSAELAG